MTHHRYLRLQVILHLTETLVKGVESEVKVGEAARPTRLAFLHQRVHVSTQLQQRPEYSSYNTGQSTATTTEARVQQAEDGS